MPAINDPTQLTAVIGFTLPQSQLDHDESQYCEYRKGVQRPFEYIRVPVTDLRPELEAASSSVSEQLAARGFAVAKHQSKLLGGIPSEEGTQLYLDECCTLLQEILGCSRVIAWNSVCRQNDPEKVKIKDVPMQKGPEKGFIPTSRLQPIAGFAHVDQDAIWGKELCGKAAQQSADEFKRCMIVNIWRPLNGPVTNAPLAMLDFRALDPSDVSIHGHMFGSGYDLHHNSSQRWAYVRHQMPDEIVYLKCFDSALGADGSAKYSAHVAVQVDGDAEGIPDELIRPRESIEVRLVAIWD